MILPGYVLTCVDALEHAGFSAYAVGGCVRDSLLGLTPADYDLCTDATPEQMHRVFEGFSLVTSGEKHGTVGVILEHQVVEITTFRTEGDYADSRHPDWVRFVSHIQEDLSRRDFTVNAMALTTEGEVIDPFGGQDDLKKNILRAVGDPETRFREDALRILRGVRFSVRYGLTPDPATAEAMESLAILTNHLARERVFDELCKLLLAVSVEDLLRYQPILTRVLPELAPAVDFCQHSRHHRYDVYTHTAHAVAAAPADLAVRWAALLHDTGKVETFSVDESGHGHFYGHAKKSAQLADAALLRLKAPTALRERVTLLIEHHMTEFAPEHKLLRRRLSRFGLEAVRQMIALQKADDSSKGVDDRSSEFAEIERVLEEVLAENACLRVADLAVNGHDLMALGYSGKAIGKELDRLLELVLDEAVPNEKQALLVAAQLR